MKVKRIGEITEYTDSYDDYEYRDVTVRVGVTVPMKTMIRFGARNSIIVKKTSSWR